MKFLFAYILAAIFSFLNAQTLQENKYVHFQAHLQKNTLHAGDTTVFAITLTPSSGIHVNSIPPMTFSLDSTASRSLEKVGSLSFEKLDTTSFLNYAKPVTQSFKISSKSFSGAYKLKGTFTYFFCSDVEGWCSKWRQPVEVSFRVVK